LPFGGLHDDGLILRKGDFGFMECACCLGYVVVVVVCSVWAVDALLVWI